MGRRRVGEPTTQHRLACVSLSVQSGERGQQCLTQQSTDADFVARGLNDLVHRLSIAPDRMSAHRPDRMSLCVGKRPTFRRLSSLAGGSARPAVRGGLHLRVLTQRSGRWPEQSQIPCALDGVGAFVDVELGINLTHMRLDGACRDEELGGDLWRREIARKISEHPQLALTQRLAERHRFVRAWLKWRSREHIQDV